MFHSLYSRTVLWRLALIAGLGLAPPMLQADGQSGPYLAARSADLAGDHALAAVWYGRALAGDPDNPALLEDAVRVTLGLGDLDTAVGFADRLVITGVPSQLADMVHAADATRRGDWRAIFADLEGGRSVGPLIDGLTQGWALVGEGQMTRAVTTFDEVADTRGLRPFGLYHKALALAAVGDFGGAEAIMALPPQDGFQMTRRAAIARAQVLGQLGRPDDAVALIDSVFGGEPDAALRAVRDNLAAGEVVPFDFIASPVEGIAEVYLSVAGSLLGEAPDELVLMYLQIALTLHPADTEIILMTAALLDQMDRHAPAIATYALVPSDDPGFPPAEMGRAEALRRSGEVETAIEVLSSLARSHGNIAGVHVRLGDVLRTSERFDAARDAYSSALDLLPAEDPSRWFVLFTRAIAQHQLDAWDEAEVDLRAALALRPDQPQVLNYLGYSLVEEGVKLDEALDMIERAVAGDPQNGAIVDSLGWVYYRLARYDEAVVQLERAAELLPIDPIINDHLGDAYWAVGRQREAQFQWSRALSFEPEEDESLRIRRKIEVGLDQVLVEEGADPLAVANGGG